MSVHWKIRLEGGVMKNQYIRGLGQFADVFYSLIHMYLKIHKNEISPMSQYIWMCYSLMAIFLTVDVKIFNTQWKQYETSLFPMLV